MNNAVFGGEEASSAIQRASASNKLHKLDLDWCVDSQDCVPWKDQGDIGLERIKHVKELFDKGPSEPSI